MSGPRKFAIVLGVLVLLAAAWLLRNPAREEKGTEVETGGVVVRSNAPATSVEVLVEPPDPKAVALKRLADLLEISDPLEREAAMNLFVSEIGIEEISAVLDLLGQGRPSNITNDLKRRLVRRWAQENPREAAAWVLEKAADAEKQEMINGIATAWAQASLAEAIAWVRELPAERRDEAAIKVAYEATETEPLTALELVRELPGTERRDELIGFITSNWAVKSPDEAGKWALQIEDQALRERTLAGIAIAWGETDPNAAAALAINSMTPGKPQNDAVMGIVQRWAQSNATEAAAWVTQFPEGPLRQSATEELVKLWADKNTDAAGTWLQNLEAGPSRDRAIGAYVGKLVLTFPGLVARWATQIQGEEQRNRELERVAEAWLGSNRQAAREWIASAGFSEETRARLLQDSPE